MDGVDPRKEYIRLRRQGLSHEEIVQRKREVLQQPLIDKTQRIFESITQLKQQAEQLKAELRQEVIALDPLEPARAQLQYLKSSLTRLESEQKNLLDTLQKTKTGLKSLQSDYVKIVVLLHRLKRELNTTSPDPLNKFLGECSERLNYKIAQKVRK